MGVVELVLGAVGHDALNAQQGPPTEATGITASSLASLDLGHWDENKRTTPLVYVVLDISREP